MYFHIPDSSYCTQNLRVLCNPFVATSTFLWSYFLLNAWQVPICYIIFHFKNIIYCMWNHTVCKLLELAFFTQHHILKIHLGHCVYQSLFIFIADQYSMVWLYQSLFNYSHIEGHPGHFYFWLLQNKATINIYRQVFV